jgi:hypothetical protein
MNHYHIGYEISFQEFSRLLSHLEYRASIAPLLKQWFDYELTGMGELTEVRSASGELVDHQALYEEIQDNRQRQCDLYQMAMSFWR